MEEILEENVNIIKLTDEEGVESEFEFIDLIKRKRKEKTPEEQKVMAIFVNVRMADGNAV